uniref:C-type lectin domain-containing protein n=1 Tax=Bubo bubo TaxID=30461 RepID=A0A8C0IHT1_BUBBB
PSQPTTRPKPLGAFQPVVGEDLGSPFGLSHGSFSSSACSGCKLCPQEWQLHGDRCYWLSKEKGNWTQGKKGCENQEAQLVVLRNKKEKDFLNQTLRKPTTYFWIGLSVPPAGQGWTWLNGSRLAPGCPKAEFGKCGALRRGRIVSESCSSELQWICQKPAPQL